ncbi:MAG: hypothetical protein Q9200_000207 [Gallowayella weberi]
MDSPRQQQQQQHQRRHRVRKRAPNAFLTSLERQAGLSHAQSSQGLEQDRLTPALSPDESDDVNLQAGLDVPNPHPLPNHIGEPSASNDYAYTNVQHGPRRESTLTDQGFTNPLVSGQSIYVADSTGQPSYLGTSSNWSFGRRILSDAHEHVFGTPLPAASLLFEGQTYDLGWDGRRASVVFNEATLPTSDFALFLINAVKFHCGQLFHLFDELDFMRNFSNFHDPLHRGDCSDLWHIHYLLILALGKAFIVRVGQDRRPPGASEYTQAVKLLPDTMLGKRCE